MKKLILIVAFVFASLVMDAQVINLVQDKDYAVSNDWTEIVRNFKKLAVFDDGTAMISHTNENRYSLFDVNGNLMKNINIYFNDGKKKPFNLQPVFGKIGEVFFTGTNSQGNIYFFDNNGLIVKEITVDCSIYNMVPLTESHIAIYGGVSWKTRWRDFVAILDVQTCKYKIIFDYYQDMKIKHSDYYIYAKACVNRRPEIIKVSDNIIIATPYDGMVRVYDFAGNKVSESKLDWQPKTMSVDEQKKMQSEAIAKYKKESAETQYNHDLLKEFIERLEKGMEHITEPLELSWFASAIKGCGDNILFFGYVEEAGRNTFHTYSVGQSKTVSENSFLSSDFDLSITKNKFVISNGFVYGVQQVKDSIENTRLVKFEMK